MERLASLYRTTLGKKVIVAVTGIVMLGFLVGHVSGNLKVFLPDMPDGTPDIDVYGQYLREIGEPLLPHAGLLWFARIVLLVSLVLHVICVMQLSTGNLTAREVDYQKREYRQASPSARWMMYSGGFLLVFIVFHLAHLTLGIIQPGLFEHGAVYANLYQAFTQPLFAGIYAVSMVIIALHLFHGTWSLFQTLGLDNPDRNRGLRRLAAVVAVGLAVAFVAVPIAFLSGALKEKPGSTGKPHTSHASATAEIQTSAHITGSEDTP